MAPKDKDRGLPPGLLSGLLFFAVVLAGSGYIVFSKLRDFAPVFVTAVPVLIMIGYALLLGLARLFRLRDDQSGDNLYYMGFLFTLTSLGVSLYQFSPDSGSEQIVRNFGIAIASTIAGIALRIFFNQMRRDPIEVEATARLELAEASRKVKVELESTILEFSSFRRMTQQSLGDALDELKETLGETRKELASEIKEFAVTARQPLEDASKRSGEALNMMNSQATRTFEAMSKQLVEQGDRLTRSTAIMIKAIDTVVGKLASLQTPEQIIEIKLAPMIQGLSRAVNSFNKSAETQAKAMDESLRQTQALAAALNDLMNEIRAENAERYATGPWAGRGHNT